MLERRQLYLEDQFLRQERDLLRLSRQITILQDFITLHFDTFRDYSFNRERSAERHLDSSLVRAPQFLLISEPRGSTERDDLAPSSPVDLTTTWRYNEQTQSPSPVLSRSTLSIPKDLSANERLGGDWDDSSNHSEATDAPDTLVSNGVPSMMTYGGTVNAYSSPVSPRLSNSSSPYDSVLGRILRSEPTHNINQHELSPLVSTSLTTTTTTECPKLHWSCGTVTTTTNTKTPAFSKCLGAFDDLPSESSDDNHCKAIGEDLYSFASSLKVNLASTVLAPVTPSNELTKSKKTSVKRPRKPKDPKSTVKPRRSPHPSTSKPKKSSKRKTQSGSENLTTDSPSGNLNDHPCSSSSESCTNSNSNTSASGSGTGAKKCRFCGKTFQWSHSVKTHERLHTGDKPYLCQLCGTRFTQNGNLKVHAKTCVGKYAELYKSKNIFVCPLCTEMFQSMDSLMEHQRNHDRMQWSDKDKTCRYCGQVFQKRSLLLSHEMAQHVQQKAEDEEQEQRDISTSCDKDLPSDSNE